MDQCKTSFPILRRRVSKEIQSRSVPPIKTYLTGALVHRQGVNAYKKIGYSFFDFTQYTHDVNLNISVLLEILKDFKQSHGKVLHLQMDSASNNKNCHMIAFGGVLVHRKIFKEVYLHMLPVGHTHEDVDAMFHSIAEVLKVDVITFKDLIQQIKKVGFIKTATSIQTVWDVKSWLEPTMAGCHNFNDCFHIQIHYNEDGKIVWNYKKWAKSQKWLPDSNDRTSYLNDQDKNGIVIFKNLPPEDTPSIKEPCWSEDLKKQLQNVKSKLLASGLLFEEEQDWWENVTTENLQEPVLEVPECPLKFLLPYEGIEEELVIPEELTNIKQRQKRVNVVYSGKYVPPSKRLMLEQSEPVNSHDAQIQNVNEIEGRFPVVTKSGRRATKFVALHD
ncbi:uncharacterized protein LOC134723501 [Mytilus trossulus]|uniref:uncharacterized protein LOC134723501 n=2 Tax=Mytilus trossulus TaxID=6551 RepID=UPI0030047AD8